MTHGMLYLFVYELCDLDKLDNHFIRSALCTTEVFGPSQFH